MNRQGSADRLRTKIVVIEHPDSNDPAINLALEEHMVRHADVSSGAFILFYVNRPSVIVGKHQNVWQEADVSFCRQNGIPVLRRVSGGGAVFHDEGNLNFSFITRHTLQNFNRYRQFLQPIVEALSKFKLKVEIDARNNLVIGGKKVSGNAQFTSRGVLLSHGTLLVRSDLELMRKSLQADRQSIVQSNATDSTPASVANLQDFTDAPLEPDQVKQAIIKRLFCSKPETLKLQENDWQKILHLAKTKYREWHWNFARSPRFIIRKTVGVGAQQLDLQLTIDKGRIAQLNCPQQPQVAARLAPYLLNQPFEFQILKTSIAEAGRNPALGSVNLLPLLNGL